MKNNVSFVKDSHVQTEYLYSELLGFQTLPIVQYKRTKEHNVSETGYVAILRKWGIYLLFWVP
jgi:hypothetical protein